MKISIVCVYNNKNQLENQLIKSLNNQKTSFEFIKIDNINNCFTSAAEALNYGASKATGDILIFSHQDIYLKTENELSELARAISLCDRGTIVGTQGVKEPSKIYYTNLTSGEKYDPTIITRFPKKLFDVSCVDEGLFGMKRETWEFHHFDEKLCDNWHLYCVEACLYNRKNGGHVYSFPSQVHHFSKGTISLKYMKNLKLLCNAYRNDFKYIWTTCYKVRTHPIYINCLIACWIFYKKIRRKKI